MAIRTTDEAFTCVTLLCTKCVQFTGHLWWGFAQIYAFPCVHVFTDSSLASNEIGNAPRYVCPCVIPVQNAEREAPSCVVGAACQCCPSGTDTHGASGLLNRLPGWAGSHTSGERERESEGREEGKGWRKRQRAVTHLLSNKWKSSVSWCLDSERLSQHKKINII